MDLSLIGNFSSGGKNNMKLVKSYIVDLPVVLFRYKYGINIDDALDLCHERGKILSPIVWQKVAVSTGIGFILEEQPHELYLRFISDLIVKNDEIASFKEEVVEIS